MRSDSEWYVGIDQGERHQVLIADSAGDVVAERSFSYNGRGIAALVDWVDETVGGAMEQVAMGTETPRGPVVEAFLAAGAAVYAINPKQLDRFRDRFSPAGAKDDQRDALVLADSLRTDQHRFDCIEAHPAVLVELREAGRLRDRVKEEFNRLCNQLRAQLHAVWPDLLTLCPAANEPWLWTLLERAPHAAKARRLHRKTLAGILRTHRIRRFDSLTLKRVLRQPLVPVAPGAVEAARFEIELLVPRLRLVDTQLKSCRRRLEQLLEQCTIDEEAENEKRGGRRRYSDVEILRSLPGIGTIVAATLLGEAARLLQDYQHARTVSGAAPVTRRSGKTTVVVRRHACNHRLSDALHYWADNARLNDDHFSQRYRELRDRGHTHGRSLRQIGDSLLRTLAAMLRDRELYDPDHAARNDTLTMEAA